jgi:hypothetical protein
LDTLVQQQQVTISQSSYKPSRLAAATVALSADLISYNYKIGTYSLSHLFAVFPPAHPSLPCQPLQVLSYHVIPAGAVLSSQLTNGQQVATALAGAAPLTVNIAGGKVTFKGANSDATVVVPDITAGQSVVHVVNDVLLPAGMGTAETAASG